MDEQLQLASACSCNTVKAGPGLELAIVKTFTVNIVTLLHMPAHDAREVKVSRRVPQGDGD